MHLSALIDTANPVDIHVGAMIRMRRKMLGVSQDQLAHGLAISFQQVQKYERGDNRVSASRLYEIARQLSVRTSYFFDGLPEPDCEDEGLPRPQLGERVGPEELSLLAAFGKIPSDRMRAELVALVRSISTTAS